MSNGIIKPDIHGRDHRPGGADPIPALEELILSTALTHGEGRYQITGDGSITVAAGGAGTIDWAHISGDALLDLSSPSAPTPVQSGWYTVDATFASTSPGWTLGSGRICQIEFHGLQFKFAWTTHTVGIAELAQGYVGLSGHLRSGTDYIAIILENLDSVSQDLTLDTIEVSMVYATA